MPPPVASSVGAPAVFATAATMEQRGGHGCTLRSGRRLRRRSNNSGPGSSTTGLNAKDAVEDGADVVVLKEATASLDDGGEDGEMARTCR
eukprot:CAMPEP_0183314624 /NCGR_PEP_ID=MMETSP0160_2-20130417/49082_1 /TAXON_ID=2839 ORGANISM="Odontella Sinensis, Strain Grunow 1884" /NCGR_SAMPLE_ID=MMETSP0160_2 /ASSEMBLY_ACC=CAM_ASM_000250 /LENGTH=89 /DNA_ID=CAMNT_0025480003 /DNA_START=120 /DNA_END=386 /DNA_ORIENTATION=-